MYLIFVIYPTKIVNTWPTQEVLVNNENEGFHRQDTVHHKDMKVIQVTKTKTSK